MHSYNPSNLVLHPGNSTDPDVVVEVTPELAGWDYIHFQLRRLNAQSSWAFATGNYELAIVVLSGCLSVESDRGQWQRIGERSSVFSGLPSALYLPRHTSLTVSAETLCEYAVALAPTDQDHEPRLVTQRDIEVEIRGGDNATRQINSILPPGFPCHRLVVVEVYTPSGNWSSYPPHKHDVHKIDYAGKVVEADLEEVYFYKLNPSEGFAFQRIYTDPNLRCIKPDTRLMLPWLHRITILCLYLKVTIQSPVLPVTRPIISMFWLVAPNHLPIAKIRTTNGSGRTTNYEIRVCLFMMLSVDRSEIGSR